MLGCPTIGLERIAGNFWGGKLFANWWKIWFLQRKLSQTACCAAPKDATPTEKTFMNSHKNAKFAKVFSLESFPLYCETVAKFQGLATIFPPSISAGKIFTMCTLGNLQWFRRRGRLELTFSSSSPPVFFSLVPLKASSSLHEPPRAVLVWECECEDVSVKCEAGRGDKLHTYLSSSLLQLCRSELFSLSLLW